MADYTSKWNLSTIPDDVFYREVGRRRVSKRPADLAIGQPKVMRPCPYCKEKFGARDLRAHKPRCSSRP